MKEIFNFKRFGSYMASDLRSCIADYGLSMLLISLMGVIIYVGTVIMGMIFNGSWGGPELSFRTAVFAMSMFVLFVTMPVKCYGKITEKKAGADFILVPASGLEKFLSMVIMTVFAAPLATAFVYLSFDAILCAVDISCGESIISSVSNTLNGVIAEAALAEGVPYDFPQMEDFIRQVTNPWLYVDDLIGFSLIFLLGAIYFNRSKTVKTFIAFFMITSVLGMTLIPAVQAVFGDISFAGSLSSEDVDNIFSMGIFRNAALIDTVNDTVVNILLLVGIYFRIKTLKH